MEKKLYLVENIPKGAPKGRVGNLNQNCQVFPVEWECFIF